MIDIFTYLDSKQFLKDCYEERKRSNPSFSYRYISAKVGINASTFVRILQGKRTISSKILPKLANVFKLNKREFEYFELLVSFNQAGTRQEKKLFFEKLISFNRAKIKSLIADKYEVFDKWYYIAIRELLSHFSFKDDYVFLARMLKPSIKPKAAKKAIELLSKLNLIEKNESGEWKATDKFITVGDNWKSIALANYQIDTMKLAQESIDRFSSKERDVSTLTISINADKLEDIRLKIRNIRKEILELENMESHPDTVFQVNFQVFPLTESTKEIIK